MIAIDTNVVVRFLTNDDPAQANRAEKVVRTENIFLPKTVLLETAWVLQGAYGLVRADVAPALHADSTG